MNSTNLDFSGSEVIAGIPVASLWILCQSFVLVLRQGFPVSL